MTIAYSLSHEDYVAFNLYYAKHDPALIRRVRLLQGIGAALLLVLGILSSRLLGGLTLARLVPFLVLAALFVLFVNNQMRSTVEKQVRLTAEDAQDLPLGERTLKLGTAALTLRDQRGTQTIDFTQIERTIRIKTHLFLITAAREVVVVPLSAFDTVDDAQQFYAALPNSQTV